MTASSAICSVSRTLDIVADPWTFLVLREAWFGVRRFEEFRRLLGMPRGTLSARLAHLCGNDMLCRRRYQTNPDRSEYRLTPKSADLYPSMLVLMHWGDRWRAESSGPPLLLRHNVCAHQCHADVVCSECREPVPIVSVRYGPGPGAGFESAAPLPRMRRSSKPENFLRHRDCSVARTMQIVGDRWTYLIMREAYFGEHRFHRVQHNLGISANTLSNRLHRLCKEGIFERRSYSLNPKRFEYRFTEKGRELYAAMIALMRWGDRWLAGDAGAPLRLRHRKCGHDFHALVVCSECRAPIQMGEMSYKHRSGVQSRDDKSTAKAGDNAEQLAAGEA